MLESPATYVTPPLIQNSFHASTNHFLNFTQGAYLHINLTTLEPNVEGTLPLNFPVLCRGFGNGSRYLPYSFNT